MDGLGLTTGHAARLARRLPIGAPASVAIHLLLGALAILVSPVRPFAVPPVEPIEVEIVTPGEMPAVAAPAPPLPAALSTPTTTSQPALPQAPAPTPPAAGTDAQSGGMVTARQFYAASLLREPGMARIRRTLTQLADADRLAQLCVIEGVEQIRRSAPGYAPETIVPYAMADTRTDRLTIVAPGAAFRSGGQWYEVSFSCTITAQYDRVTAFSFSLGAPIPRSAWEEHNLNAVDEEEQEPTR